jgi:hypothetical protein
VGWLRGDTLQEVVEGNPKLMVSGGQTPWQASHVVRLADRHLVPTDGNQSTTLIL